MARLLAAGAPIDGFGVGSALAVSQDAPVLDMAYKLVAYTGRGIKLSAGKSFLPGRKQVFRVEREGRAEWDVLACHDKPVPGRPLLRRVMHHGLRLPEARVELARALELARHELGVLPPQVRALAPMAAPYPVEISVALRAARERVIDDLGRRR